MSENFEDTYKLLFHPLRYTCNCNERGFPVPTIEMTLLDQHNAFCEQLLQDLPPARKYVIQRYSGELETIESDGSERPELGERDTLLSARWRGDWHKSGAHRYIELSFKVHMRGLGIESDGAPQGVSQIPFAVLGLSGLVFAPNSIVLSGPSGFAVARAMRPYIDAMY